MVLYELLGALLVALVLGCGVVTVLRWLEKKEQLNGTDKDVGHG